MWKILRSGEVQLNMLMLHLYAVAPWPGPQMLFHLCLHVRHVTFKFRMLLRESSLILLYLSSCALHIFIFILIDLLYWASMQSAQLYLLTSPFYHFKFKTATSQQAWGWCEDHEADGNVFVKRSKGMKQGHSVDATPPFLFRALARAHQKTPPYITNKKKHRWNNYPQYIYPLFNVCVSASFKVATL